MVKRNGVTHKQNGITRKEYNDAQKIVKFYKKHHNLITKLKEKAKWARLLYKAKIEGHPSMLLLQNAFNTS